MHRVFGKWREASNRHCRGQQILLGVCGTELNFKEVESSQDKWRFLGMGPWKACQEFLGKEKKNPP